MYFLCILYNKPQCRILLVFIYRTIARKVTLPNIADDTVVEEALKNL